MQVNLVIIYLIIWIQALIHMFNIKTYNFICLYAIPKRQHHKMTVETVTSNLTVSWTDLILIHKRSKNGQIQLRKRLKNIYDIREWYAVNFEHVQSLKRTVPFIKVSHVQETYQSSIINFWKTKIKSKKS